MWLNSLSYVCQEIAFEPLHKILQENPLKSLYNEIVKNKYWISIVKCITYQHWCNKNNKKRMNRYFQKGRNKKIRYEGIYIMIKKKEWKKKIFFTHSNYIKVATKQIIITMMHPYILQWEW